MSQAERYLRDHAVVPPEAASLPDPPSDLRICVVIPAYDELDRIEAVLDSLEKATDGEQPVFETIVCVNQAETAPPEIARANSKTLELLDDKTTSYPLHVLDRASEGRRFPRDAAGVGEARRRLMDLAMQRLTKAGHPRDGLIACLDGDSPAEPGYLDAIVDEMADAGEEALAGVCRYRHPIPDDPEHARAIVTYETWMRYFELGLHHIETPYAYQPIGSCMVLTTHGYALADGVPTLEALSDFYLLQKVAKVGGFGAVRRLHEPVVRPSARPSDRVPRGTGPSVQRTMHESDDRFENVEPPTAFHHLHVWLDAVPAGFDSPDLLREKASDPLRTFLADHGARDVLPKLRRNAPDAEHFAEHVHRWFDSLKIVKYANQRARSNGRTWIFEALRQLLTLAGHDALAAQVPDSKRSATTLDQRISALELLREHARDATEA